MKPFLPSSTAITPPGALVLALAAWLGGAGAAQANEASIHLRSASEAITRLAPGATADSAMFTLDVGGAIIVQIVAVQGDQSPFAALTTSIETPTGQMITPANVAMFAGSYGDFGGSDAPDSPLVSPAALPGHHYLYLLPFLGAGTYTIHLSAPGITQDVAVYTEVITDSPVAANMVATQPVVSTGSSVVLVAAVFDGAAPVLGAAVAATVTTPSLSEFAVNLLDDGQDPDTAAGDGLYGGMFTADEPGIYWVSSVIQGSTPRGGGVSFLRSASAVVESVAPGAMFSGASFVDFGEDDNANGLFDRMVIQAAVDILETDEYDLSVLLSTPANQLFFAAGQAVLTPGPQTIAAEVSAPALREIGEDGPYVILSAELTRLGTEGARPAALLEEIMQPTQPYLLSQFERPPLELTGFNNDSAADLDMNGKFDALTFDLGINAVSGGIYQYSARLTSPCGSEIQFIAGSAALTGGGLDEHLTLAFNGASIGTHGVDGPYFVRDLVVFNNTASLLTTDAGETSAYTADQFQDFTTGDCNANLIADACEVFLRLAPDCNANQRPDECDIAGAVSMDCNADGRPDECAVEDTFRLDDGTFESSVGFTQGGDAIWLNRFTVVAGGEIIRELSVAWGFGVPDGTPTTLMIYDDPDNDGIPADAVLLATTQITSRNANTGLLTRVPVPPTAVGNPGDSFFIGAYITIGPSVFPAVIDGNSGSQQRSWLGGSLTPGGASITELSANPIPMTLIDDFGIPGNWLLRARTLSDWNENGIPDECEPDCNANFLPDDFDLASGLVPDCNANNAIDSCEIADDPDQDVNQNGILDACEDCAAPLGSADVPPLGNLDAGDYQAFAPCLSGPDEDAASGCGVMDINGNCRVDLVDFAAFQNAFGGAVSSTGGACCLDDGSCADVAGPPACTTLSGNYQGNGLSCAGVVCPQPQACCFSGGACDDRIPASCTSAGGNPQGSSTTCAATVCPFGGYTNTTSIVGPISFLSPGFTAVSDDLTLAGTLRNLVYMDLAVFGNGGGPFSVTAALFTACPDGGGTFIPGTLFIWNNIPDDATVHILLAQPAMVTIPDTVWMRVTFSTPAAGWILAGTAELGSTANVFGLTPGVCNASFGPMPHAGFYATLRCE